MVILPNRTLLAISRCHIAPFWPSCHNVLIKVKITMIAERVLFGIPAIWHPSGHQPGAIWHPCGHHVLRWGLPWACVGTMRVNPISPGGWRCHPPSRPTPSHQEGRGAIPISVEEGPIALYTHYTHTRGIVCVVLLWGCTWTLHLLKFGVASHLSIHRPLSIHYGSILGVVYLSIYLSICLSIYLSIYPSIYMCVHPGVVW